MLRNADGELTLGLSNQELLKMAESAESDNSFFVGVLTELSAQIPDVKLSDPSKAYLSILQFEIEQLQKKKNIYGFYTRKRKAEILNQARQKKLHSFAIFCLRELHNGVTKYSHVSAGLPNYFFLISLSTGLALVKAQQYFGIEFQEKSLVLLINDLVNQPKRVLNRGTIYNVIAKIEKPNANIFK